MWVCVYVLIGMNFSFKGAPKKKQQVALNPFETAEEAVSESVSQKPIDYLQLKVLMEAAQVKAAAGEADPEDQSIEIEEKTHKEREAITKRREEILGSRRSVVETKSIGSTADMKQAGLVMVNPAKDPSVRGEAKHIQRMVETAHVNEKFKNLLRIKTAERDKDKAEAEFGERPQEFVTSAYLKQKEESLRLERELEASERQKKDMSIMFREMLGSGQYARSKFVDPAAEPAVASADKPVVVAQSTIDPVEPSKELTKKVLEKLVSEESKEVTRAIQEKARQEGFRIVDQIEQLVEHDGDESREEARLSAKERYLQRKRQRALEEE